MDLGTSYRHCSERASLGGAHCEVGLVEESQNYIITGLYRSKIWEWLYQIKVAICPPQMLEAKYPLTDIVIQKILPDTNQMARRFATTVLVGR
jgi:hypothetical protein